MIHPLQTPVRRLILALHAEPLLTKHLTADKAVIVHLFFSALGHIFWILSGRGEAEVLFYWRELRPEPLLSQTQT